jgi:hypothetical protein
MLPKNQPTRLKHPTSTEWGKRGLLDVEEDEEEGAGAGAAGDEVAAVTWWYGAARCGAAVAPWEVWPTLG